MIRIVEKRPRKENWRKGERFSLAGQMGAVLRSPVRVEPFFAILREVIRLAEN
jgi:hypothetical protein